MYNKLKSLYRKIIPNKVHYRLEPFLRKIIYYIFYKGKNQYCPICKSSLKKFIPILFKESSNQKVSLATVYNTIHAFQKKGYLKEISINSSQTYFDTNTTNHHHFFDEKNKELIDLNNEDIHPIKIKKTIPGKKIKSLELLVRVDADK